MNRGARGARRGPNKGRANHDDVAAQRPMDLIASVSRSSGLEKDGDTLKDWKVQEEYLRFVQNKLTTFLKQYPSHAANTGLYSDVHRSKDQVEKIINEQENILILFRKLREGISSTKREDAFAAEVYSTSLHLSVIFASPKQTTAIIPHLSTFATSALLPRTRIILPLLHFLVQEYPSQCTFRAQLESLQQISDAAQAEDPLCAWIEQLAKSVRRMDWVQFRLLSQVGAVPRPKEGDEERESLAWKAAQKLLEDLRIKMRGTIWSVLRKAYIDFACHDGSETPAWLGDSLSLVSEPTTIDPVRWLELRCEAGEVKRKEGVDGKWLVCRGR